MFFQESNACLKEEYINISKEVDECISKIGEHTDKLTSLEIEYSDLKEALAASKKTLAEWKETYQVRFFYFLFYFMYVVRV